MLDAQVIQRKVEIKYQPNAPVRSPVVALIMLTVFACFAAVGSARQSGDDLSSSFIGCRLVADGQNAHLYSHDEEDFGDVGPDSMWVDEASDGGFEGVKHPYVQTPLWAWSLQPLCTRTDFRTFRNVFAVLTGFCFAGMVFVSARFWAPRLLNPYATAMILAGLWFSQPFQYAMFLVQTHILFVLLTLTGLILVERKWPLTGGLLIACAAAVKLTPAYLLIYWLITRQWRAALSFIGYSLALFALTIVVTGRQTVAAYLADLQWVSGVLLVTGNNQSFAAWSLARLHPLSSLLIGYVFPLPQSMRVASILLTIAGAVVGGTIDQTRKKHGVESPPIGAMFCLIAATMFSPIAWTHYYIVLVAPIMVLLQVNERLRSRSISMLLVLIALLNFKPIAGDPQYGIYLVFVRSHFYAGAICLFALGWAAWLETKSVSATASLNPASSFPVPLEVR